MKAALSHSAPRPAFGAPLADRAPRTPPSRFQRVDSLVTFAVIAWFAVALAGMVGGLGGVAPAPATQAASGMERPATLPQASTSLGNSARSKVQLI